MRSIYYGLLAFVALACLMIPDLVMAAGGGKVEMLVVVADSRVVQSPITLYFLNMYNTSPLGFGILCVILTAVLGVTLGLTADQIMAHTGLDLTSRKIIEH
jgi:hypothetical protein